MAHLGNIQQLLNTDVNYRRRFLNDPVAALAEHGLILSPEMQMQLRQMVSQAQASPRPVPGAVAGGWPLASVLKKVEPSGTGLAKYRSMGLASMGKQGPVPKHVPLIIAFE
jgi:hypothetical protein